MQATSLASDSVRVDACFPIMYQMNPGFLPLAQLPIIRLLGGDQFRKFCVICIVILVTTVWITCICHEEEERPEGYKKRR